MRSLLSLAALAILSSATACQPAQGWLCDERAAYSVNVNVSSALGTVLDAEVFFRPLGEHDPSADEDPSEAFAPCDSFGDGAFACGTELAGRIEILVEAEGYESNSQVVDVSQGACHVIAEALEVELEPLGCGDIETAPSVILSLVDDQGRRIEGAWAQWGRPDADSDPQPCDTAFNNLACGWGEAGILEIEAGAEGYLSWLGNVEVETSECRVETRYVEVVLEPVDGPCDDGVLPSIVVSVIDMGGTPMPDAEVHFVPHPKPVEPWACLSTDNGRFFCGEEQAGEFDVRVSATGYFPLSFTVQVPEGVCHVETQFIHARLEAMVIDG